MDLHILCEDYRLKKNLRKEKKNSNIIFYWIILNNMIRSHIKIKVEALQHEAYIHHSREEYELALQYYIEAAEREPHNADLWFEIGSCLHSMGNYKKALKSGLKCIELNETHYKAWFNCGLAAAAMDDNRKAVEYFTKSIEYNSKNPGSWLARGNSWFLLGDYKKASNDYKEALSLTTPISDIYRDALWNRALSYELDHKYDFAISDYSSYLEVKPDFHIARLRRGINQFYVSEYKKAIKDLSEYIKNETELTSMVYLASSYKLDDQHEDARIMFKNIFTILNKEKKDQNIKSKSLCKCPKCQKLYISQEIRKSAKRELWSDGYWKENGRSYPPIIERCQNCKNYFFIEDTIELTKIPTGIELPPDFSEISIEETIDRHSYRTAIFEFGTDDPVVEKRLRIRLWQNYNNILRDLNEDSSIVMPKEYFNNLNRLESLISPDEQVLLAEIYRENGKFKKCLKILNSATFSEDEIFLAQSVMEWARRGISRVFKL